MRYERRITRGGELLWRELVDSRSLSLSLLVVLSPSDDGKAYLWLGPDGACWFSHEEPLVVEFRPLLSLAKQLDCRKWTGRWP